jgi:periplasmic protein TonB
MSHDLFEEISAPTPRGTGRSPYTIAISIVAHIVVIALVVIVPLLATDVLPTPSAVIDDYWRTALPVVPAPAPRRATTTASTRTEAVVSTVPTEAPEGIHDEVEPAGVPGVPTIGPQTDGVPDGVPDGLGTASQGPSAPPAPHTQPSNKPYQVGGQIREPQKIFSVAPAYPGIARSARIEGIVVIEAVIGVDGAVREARVRASVPVLDQAALEAVKQWRYRPTLLNGVPVPVVMTVSVRFTLQ